jgi:hypothetical protein
MLNIREVANIGGGLFACPDCIENGLAGIAGESFRRFADIAPTARKAVELHGPFEVFQIAAPAIQDSTAITFSAGQDQGGICCTGQASRAGNLVERIFGIGLAQMMHHHHRHVVLAGDLVQAAKGRVIPGISEIRQLLLRANDGQSINDDKASVGPGGDPLPDGIQATSIETWPLSMKFEIGRP